MALLALAAAARQADRAPPSGAAHAGQRAGGRADTAVWAVARPDYRWAFPRDHWAHPTYRTEWWYFTGHLRAAGDTAPRFGYQFTLFRIGLVPGRPAARSNWAAGALIMGHAAVTDLANDRHAFSEVLYRATPLLGGFSAPGDPLVAWVRAPAGADGRWTLYRAGWGFDVAMTDDAKGLAFALAMRPERLEVFQGPNGFSRKGAGPAQASLYYSFTRLETRGSVTLGDSSWLVTGTTWMDQEFGSNQLAADQRGWDWFGLQLRDGRDLMLYVMRDTTGAVGWASGTVARPSGRPRHLGREAFAIATLAHWTSDSTGARYPARWRVTVPTEGLDLEVVPRVADQENASRLVPDLFYWEGAVLVRDRAGRPAGQGYVELVGYGTAARPAW
jgi:predicted secreted hydrolase